MEEMDHAATVRNVDPALYQQRVRCTVAVFDDPVAQSVSANAVDIQLPSSIIMSVKAGIVVFRWIVVGEITGPAAEKHPRARGVAIAGHCRPQSALADHLADLVPGGEQAPWHEVVVATARIVRVAGVPVTADIEAGYGETPDAVMRSVSEIIKAGAVGVNLEDGALRDPAPIRSLADAANRVRAAREAAEAAGVPIVINARTDLYLRNIGNEVSRFDETIERGRAYLAAGADCVYPITLRDPATIGRLVKALAAPININVRAGSPSVAELEALRVACASTASQVALMALSVTRQIADEFAGDGSV